MVAKPNRELVKLVTVWYIFHPMFDWDDIRVFLAVVRAGTVRGAARTLGITHATVSRRLRGLEERLGSQLFERVSSGQALTSVGQSILETAHQIDDKMSEIDRRAFAQDAKLSGLVRLSVSESFFQSIVHPYLLDFQTSYPSIEIELISTDRLSDLNRRDADIVIRITKTPQESAFGKKVAESPLACFAARSYLEKRPSQDRWVALTHQPAYDPILPARRVITANTGLTAAQLIKNGHGIGLLPCYIGDSDPELRRVPNTRLIPDLSVWILVHTDNRATPRVRALLNHLYESLEVSRDLIEGRQSLS